MAVTTKCDNVVRPEKRQVEKILKLTRLGPRQKTGRQNLRSPNKQPCETRKPTSYHNTRGKPARWYNMSKPKNWSDANGAKRKIEGDAKAVQKDGFGKHMKVIIKNNEARKGKNPATKMPKKKKTPKC